MCGSAFQNLSNPTPFIYEPPHDKTNNVAVRPAKTQISLGIRPVWSESSLCAQRVANGPSFLHADSKEWSDWADAKADLSLRLAHGYFVSFVMRRLIYYLSERGSFGQHIFRTAHRLGSYWHPRPSCFLVWHSGSTKCNFEQYMPHDHQSFTYECLECRAENGGR